MKITDAWIHDYSRYGKFEIPELCVQVDEAPDVTIEPRQFENGWTVGKYGPFVKYENLNKDVTAVDFNLAFRDRLPMVIDIVLVVDNGHDKSEILEMPFSLPLDRARQLVKKYDPSWRLLIQDREAVHGKLVWRPIQTDPECRGHGGLCGKKPASYIRIKGVDIPLCQEHTQQHNAAQAKARATLTSK